MKPLNVLVENGGDAEQVAAKLTAVPGVVGATAPPGWQKGPNSLVEGFATIDGAAPGIQAIDRPRQREPEGTDGTLTGLAAVDRDFLHALFGSFPYVLGLVLLLTMILLTRAFRSPVLAIKAIVLNLLSLAAAFGIIVFVFQQGHGSGLWDIPATGSITAWIPVMIFAFLFGLSMDYEVFMLTRMREAYDETGLHRQGDRARPRTNRQARDERGARAHVRLPRALDEPRLRDQAARDRPRGRDHLRRHRHPRPARAGADEAPRRRELVDAGVAGNGSSHPQRPAVGSRPGGSGYGAVVSPRVYVRTWARSHVLTNANIPGAKRSERSISDVSPVFVSTSA